MLVFNQLLVSIGRATKLSFYEKKNAACIYTSIKLLSHMCSWFYIYVKWNSNLKNRYVSYFEKPLSVGFNHNMNFVLTIRPSWCWAIPSSDQAILSNKMGLSNDHNQKQFTLVQISHLINHNIMWKVFSSSHLSQAS